jgi:hypothetical protein
VTVVPGLKSTDVLMRHTGGRSIINKEIARTVVNEQNAVSRHAVAKKPAAAKKTAAAATKKNANAVKKTANAVTETAGVDNVEKVDYGFAWRPQRLD